MITINVLFIIALLFGLYNTIYYGILLLICLIQPRMIRKIRSNNKEYIVSDYLLHTIFKITSTYKIKKIEEKVYSLNVAFLSISSYAYYVNRLKSHSPLNSIFLALFLLIKIYRNNKKYASGIDCPLCKNKMQLVKMGIFDESKDICNVCNYEEYSYILREEK